MTFCVVAIIPRLFILVRSKFGRPRTRWKASQNPESCPAASVGLLKHSPFLVQAYRPCYICGVKNKTTQACARVHRVLFFYWGAEELGTADMHLNIVQHPLPPRCSVIKNNATGRRAERRYASNTRDTANVRFAGLPLGMPSSSDPSPAGRWLCVQGRICFYNLCLLFRTEGTCDSRVHGKGRVASHVHQPHYLR